MSSKTLRTILVSVTLVTGSLMLCFALGLPLIAVLPEGIRSELPLWGFLAPLFGSLSALLLALSRSQALKRGAPPGRVANLPSQFVLLFILSTTAALLLGALVEPHPLLFHRPMVVFLGGPALAVAHGLVLRALVHPALTADLTQRSAENTMPGVRRRGPDREEHGGIGVLAITPSLTIVTAFLTLVALTLVGVHAHSTARYNQERRTAAHLENLLQVVWMQVANIPAWQVPRFLAEYPPNDHGIPVLVDDDSRLRTPLLGLPERTRIAIDEERKLCTINARRFTCVGGPKRGLVVIHPLEIGGPSERLFSLNTRLVLLAIGFFIFAAALGWAIGHDISRDFRTITSQLSSMAHQDHLDLGRMVTVTSIDEVGDLTEALGKLRTSLDHELAEHQESLRKVREAEQTKNAFFSNVSQELRTPLTTLCGHAQLLLDGSVGMLSPPQQQDVHSIYMGGQQLLALVSDVLDISVIESGHLKLSIEPVNVGELCADLVQRQRSVVKTSGEGEVDLEVEKGDDLPLIQADPRRLTQVVQNLLSNAMKFTQRGSITVRIQRDDEHVVIAVQDTGSGISSQELRHVFSRYQQAGELHARRGGTGLGLAICKHLVELHGGTISVESAIDCGSTFTLLLPVAGPRDKRKAA